MTPPVVIALVCCLLLCPAGSLSAQAGEPPEAPADDGSTSAAEAPAAGPEVPQTDDPAGAVPAESGAPPAGDGDAQSADAPAPEPPALAREAPGTTQPQPPANADSGPMIDIDMLDEASVPQQADPGDGGNGGSGHGHGDSHGDGTLIERIETGHGGVTLGGYGQHEFQVPEGKDPFFRNHRYIIFIFGRIHDRITTATEIEFEFAGSPLKKDGTMGPGEVLLEFSVIDFRVADWLILRAGVLLVPVGSFNINHDAPTRDLIDRPIAYTTVIPTTWFESGAGILGTVPLGDQALDYQLYAINGLDSRIYDGFGLRAARGSHFEDNNGDIAFVGRLAWRPTLGLEIGVSGYTGEYDKREHRVNIGNLDIKLRVGPLEVLAEAAYVKIDPGFVEGFSSSSVANTRDAVPTAMLGFYGQLNYHFTIGPLWSLLPDDLQNAILTGVIRYEGKDTDTEHHSADGDQRRLTLGLNFRPIEQLVLKSDFQWNASGNAKQRAPEVWAGDFWAGRDADFLFDSYVTSVAYLF